METTSSPPPSHTSTTSSDIQIWRKATLSRFQKEPGYADALEEASASQRSAEVRWLETKANSKWKFSLSGCELPPSQTAKDIIHEAMEEIKAERNNGILFASALAKGVNSIFAAPDVSKSMIARHRLWSFLSEFRIACIRKDAKAAISAARKTPFSVKIPVGSDDASVDDLRHEAIVCIYGTNQMRIMIPNFPFVYAYCSCSSASSFDTAAGNSSSRPRFMPASPRRKRATAAASSETATKSAVSMFLVLENVDTNYTLEDAIKDPSSPISVCDFFLVIIQIAYALKFASEKISFTHYDLHPRNILLRKIEGISSSLSASVVTKKDYSDYAYIPYERGSVFVAAKYVASLTEFGFSHISAVNSQNRSVSFGFSAKGRAELVELGIFRDRSNPITDIYRLIMTSADVAKTAKNIGVLEVASAAAKYFNTQETLTEILDKQRENWFYLPLTTVTRAFTFEDFITHIRRASRIEKWAPTRCVTTSIPKGGYVLKCGTGFIGNSNKLIAEPLISEGPPMSPKVAVVGATGGGANLMMKNGTVATERRLYRSIYQIFPSFPDFVEAYQCITERLFTAKEVTITREFTEDFIGGFTRGESHFHTTIAETKDALDASLQRMASIVESLPEGGRMILAKNAKRSMATMVRVCATATAVMLTEYLYVRDLISAIYFASDLYWNDEDCETRPKIVNDVILHANKILDSMTETLEAVVKGYKSDDREQLKSIIGENNVLAIDSLIQDVLTN